MKLYRLFFFLILLLPACSQGTFGGVPVRTLTPSPGNQPKGDVNSPHSPGGNPSGEGRLNGAVIVFSVSGGFAGVSREWIIYPDGRAVNRMGEEILADPGEIKELLNQIEALGILDIKDTSGRMTDCRDCFTYNITLQTDTEIFDFMVVEGDSETPAELLEAAHAIDLFIQELTEE